MFNVNSGILVANCHISPDMQWRIQLTFFARHFDVLLSFSKAAFRRFCLKTKLLNGVFYHFLNPNGKYCNEFFVVNSKQQISAPKSTNLNPLLISDNFYIRNIE